MENNNKENQTLSTEQVLTEILENSRKTKKYMQWQFYITIVLIVLPLLGMVIALPLALKSLGTLGSVYTGGLQ